MTIELLLEKRIIVGENLLNIIRDNGYTKSSFAKVIDITRPTLDLLLAGEINSLTKYKQYIEKITRSQVMTKEQLLNYVTKYNANSEMGYMTSNEAIGYDKPDLLHSYGEFENHEINRSAKEMFSILDDILNICEVYYG